MEFWTVSSSHRNSGPGHHSRAILTKVDDSGPQQLVEVTGLNGQTVGEAVRSQHGGLSTVPPKDSEGTMLMLGGGADRVHALGIEHPPSRPRNRPVGSAMLYQTNNNKNHVEVEPAQVEVTHDKQIVFKIGDTVVAVVDKDGWHFKNVPVDHEGKRIDSTHKHVDAGGSGLSGVPE
jgi:phage gp45-like